MHDIGPAPGFGGRIAAIVHVFYEDLTAEVQRYLRNIPYGFDTYICTDTPGKRTAEDLLKQYTQASGGKFVYRMEDPDRSPGLARRYGVSRWAWLASDNGKLVVTKTSNAELPLTKGQKALLTVDVWEHAYYIDYRNMRPKFVETFLDKLVNWSFAEANFA